MKESTIPKQMSVKELASYLINHNNKDINALALELEKNFGIKPKQD